VVEVKDHYGYNDESESWREGLLMVSLDSSAGSFFVLFLMYHQLDVVGPRGCLGENVVSQVQRQEFDTDICNNY
jgi:hypothetical protein